MYVNQYYKEQNLRNIGVSDLSKSIYRIIPIAHLELMLRERTLALAKTSSWEDVYENFFFKENFFAQGTRIVMDHLGNRIFGQCWSLFRDSDAMWRIYSHNKRSVRIKTTIGKLYDTVYLDDNCMASTYIGAVEYKSPKQLDEWIKENNRVSVSNLSKIMIESLFFKRYNFSHEKEVRVIYQPASNSSDCSNTLKIYPIDINDFLEEVTFDPRAEDVFMHDCMKMITTYNYPMCRVNKSSLYDFKQVNIDIIN